METQVGSARPRKWLSIVLPTVVSLWASEWGCGGIVEDSRAGRDGGTAGSVSNPKLRPIGPNSTCGNGALDDGEQCDGVLFTSDVGSCSAATLGNLPFGTVACTTSCVVDVTGCFGGSSPGGPSTGGQPGIPPMMGGAVGIGGFGAVGGMFGMPSTPATCYAKGGVPDSTTSENCSFGSTATNTCLNKRSSGSCADKCGCVDCPSVYDHCMNDGACFWIFSCAQQAPCYSISSCEQAGCSNMIATAGGPGTPGAALADQVLGCFLSANCPLSCNLPPPH